MFPHTRSISLISLFLKQLHPALTIFFLQKKIFWSRQDFCGGRGNTSSLWNGASFLSPPSIFAFLGSVKYHRTAHFPESLPKKAYVSTWQKSVELYWECMATCIKTLLGPRYCVGINLIIIFMKSCSYSSPNSFFDLDFGGFPIDFQLFPTNSNWRA